MGSTGGSTERDARLEMGRAVAVMMEPKILNSDFLNRVVDTAYSTDYRERVKARRALGAEVVGPVPDGAAAERERYVDALDRLPSFPRVLAVDPGTHTGWCVLWFDPDVVFDKGAPIARSHLAFHCGMLLGDENSQVDHLVSIGKRYRVGGEGLAVVHESFRVRSVRMEETFLSPARVTAAHRWALHRGVRDFDGVLRKRRVWMQEAVDAKSVATDARLQVMDMYLPGADHPRDATRHAVLWVRLLRSRGESFYDNAHFVDPLPEAAEREAEGLVAGGLSEREAAGLASAAVVAEKVEQWKNQQGRSKRRK